MLRSLSYRWVVALSLVCLLIGSVISPLVQNRARQLPTDVDFSISTEPIEGTVDGMPALIRTERTTRTSPVEDRRLADTSSELEIFADDEKLATLTQTARLNRESTYPVAEAPAEQTLTIAATGEEFSEDLTPRDGLEYFFPSQTEQRSYPYYDPVLQEAIPVDFAGSVRLDGVPTYKFQQDISYRELDSEEELFGSVEEFYSAEERQEYGFAPGTKVVLKPYYSVSRTLWVEPTTGEIVNAMEHPSIVFAADPDTPAAETTVFDARLKWTQPVLEGARSTVTSIKVWALVTWLSNAAAVIFLILAGWLYASRRENS